MTDFEEGIDADARAMERLARAFERIADTLDCWYKWEVQRYNNEHLAKSPPRDGIVTRIPSEIERLRESQGATGETDEDWGSLGNREREFLSRSKNAASGGKTGPEPKTGGAESD